MNNQDQSASTLTADLAARIPFRMLSHLSGDKCHSGRYTNHTLGIGHEYHHPAKDGYVKTGPKVKVARWFYRESPADAPCFKTLRELLEADAELRGRAEAAYPLPNTQDQTRTQLETALSRIAGVPKLKTIHCHRCGSDWTEEDVAGGFCPNCPKHRDEHASLSVCMPNVKLTNPAAE